VLATTVIVVEEKSEGRKVKSVIRPPKRPLAFCYGMDVLYVETTQRCNKFNKIFVGSFPNLYVETIQLQSKDAKTL